MRVQKNNIMQIFGENIKSLHGLVFLNHNQNNKIDPNLVHCKYYFFAVILKVLGLFYFQPPKVQTIADLLPETTLDIEY